VQLAERAAPAQPAGAARPHGERTSGVPKDKLQGKAWQCEYFVKIGGGSYKAALVSRARGFAETGVLGRPEAEELWRGATDGPGVTATERSTLQYILDTFAASDEAKAFLRGKLGLSEETKVSAAGKSKQKLDTVVAAEDLQAKRRRKQQRYHALFFRPGAGSESFASLLELLGGCSRSLDLAVYTLTDARLTAVLLQRHKAGVCVRVIADDRAGGAGSDLHALRQAGVQVRTDHSVLLMHHKFAVLDASVCVSGSLNWTTGALRRNRENAVVARCPHLAGTFGAEFSRLWAAFDQGVDPGLADTAAEQGAEGPLVLFFPDKEDRNFGRLVAEVLAAQTSLDVAMFTLTVTELKAAMKDARSRGIRVRVIADDHQGRVNGGGLHLRELRDAGVEVRTDGAGSMHHKFCIVDGVTVCNGSFNWTRQAEDGNNENVVIYKGETELARSFVSEFEQMWAEFGE